jgi:hypothetical protein
MSKTAYVEIGGLEWHIFVYSHAYRKVDPPDLPFNYTYFCEVSSPRTGNLVTRCWSKKSSKQARENAINKVLQILKNGSVV